MSKKKKEINYDQMPVEELVRQTEKTREDLFKARFHLASAALKNPMEIRVLRREIARLETFKNQRSKKS